MNDWHSKMGTTEWEGAQNQHLWIEACVVAANSTDVVHAGKNLVQCTMRPFSPSFGPNQWPRKGTGGTLGRRGLAVTGIHSSKSQRKILESRLSSVSEKLVN